MTNQEKQILNGLIKTITHHIIHDNDINDITLAGVASRHIMCQYCPLYINQDTLCGSYESCAETIYNYLTKQ